MTVTINEPQQLDSRTWLITWSSDLQDPTFRVFKDGSLIKTTQETQMQFQLEPGENLVIEVLDDITDTPSTAFSGKLTLSWNAVANTEKYQIEEFVNSAWTRRATIIDQGQGSFQWVTRFLEDVTIHQFRIVPVGLNGNLGTPITLSALMVRHPDIPAQTMAYDGAGAKTVTIN